MQGAWSELSPPSRGRMRQDMRGAGSFGVMWLNTMLHRVPSRPPMFGPVQVSANELRMLPASVSAVPSMTAVARGASSDKAMPRTNV